MEDAKKLLKEYVNDIEKIIIEFNFNEDNAAGLLNELKNKIGKERNVPSEQKELFDACVYNALATVNTCPEQNKKSNQLLMSLTEAKEEMKAIVEYL